jgi:hypothetical protein
MIKYIWINNKYYDPIYFNKFATNYYRIAIANSLQASINDKIWIQIDKITINNSCF